MANQNLQQLRASVAKKEANASRKISRTKRVNGADIAGTQFDPRKGKEAISRMNTRQLLAHEKTLAGFSRPSTQFFGGLRGTIWTSKQVRQLAYQQGRANSAIKDVAEAIRDLPTPLGPTVGQRRAGRGDMSPARRRMAAVNDPMEPYSDDIRGRLRNMNAGELAFKTMLRQATQRATGVEDLVRRADRDRNNVYKMLDVINEPELRASIQKLTPWQFYLLWTETKFADSLSVSYETISKELGSNEDSLYNSEIQEANRNVTFAQTQYPAEPPR